MADAMEKRWPSPVRRLNGAAFIQQCCRKETRLWRCQADGDFSATPLLPSCIGSTAGADHLDVEIADLLAQGVAIDTQEVGGADLVSARCRQRGRQQRLFNLAQNAVIEPGRRQAVS